jgi:hypothetical protein
MYHVVKVVMFKPAGEASPTEAAIGQDDGANAHRQRPNYSQKRVLFELILAPVGW